MLLHYWPVFGVSILQITIYIVRVTAEAIHPTHASSSFRTDTFRFHRQRLLHLISFIHPQYVSVSAHPSLPRFQCDVFHLQFSRNFVASLSPFQVSLSLSFPLPPSLPSLYVSLSLSPSLSLFLYGIDLSQRSLIFPGFVFGN